MGKGGLPEGRGWSTGGLPEAHPKPEDCRPRAEGGHITQTTRAHGITIM